MPSSRLTTFKTHKLRGEWAELRFMTQAAEHGIMVSKPWGDSAPYDLMVEHKATSAESRLNPPLTNATHPTSAT